MGRNKSLYYNIRLLPPSSMRPPVPKIPGSHKKWKFDSYRWKWVKKTIEEKDLEEAWRIVDEIAPGWKD